MTCESIEEIEWNLLESCEGCSGSGTRIEDSRQRCDDCQGTGKEAFWDCKLDARMRHEEEAGKLEQSGIRPPWKLKL